MGIAGKAIQRYHPDILFLSQWKQNPSAAWLPQKDREHAACGIKDSAVPYEGRKEKGVMSMSDFQKHLAEQMENPDFAAEYDTLEAQYSFARQMIAARIAAGMTQAELAAKVGTSQANICKLEHAELNPSFALAQRVANGLGKRLTLSLL